MKTMLKGLLHRLGLHLVGGHLRRLKIPHHSSREAQRLLVSAWQDRVAHRRPLPSFDEAGFRAYSQTNEDGILLLLQAVLGRGAGHMVEIGCGEGDESNSANLIINHGWTATLFDGSGDSLSAARRFYAANPDTRIFPPKCHLAWFTRENINAVLRQAGVPAEPDIFSLDIDGMDYWLWEAMTEVRARIVVLEYNNVIPAEIAVTVPYSEDFRTAQPDFTGASLAAMVKLGRRKNYRLVGCSQLRYNAFFLRDGVGEDLFPEMSVEEGLDHPYPREGRETRYPPVANLGWVHV
jgi:SAM-dependent methyltransferase